MSIEPHPYQPLSQRLAKAVDHIRRRGGTTPPTVGVILGSGLGTFAARVEDAVTLPYREIPEMPTSSVVGHAGNLVLGRVGRTPVAVLQGRVHFYEGHGMDAVAFPTRLLLALGVRTLVVTNAAGGINDRYRPGDLVLIEDHLSLFPEHPLRGINEDAMGPRFPDMTQAYDPTLRALASAVAERQGFTMHAGVYAALPGPSYETPAEVRMLRTLGADLCGMSTVPEVIVARHQGARVLGISCVTNMAAGITGQPLSHDEVTETATRVRDRFVGLLGGILAELAP